MKYINDEEYELSTGRIIYAYAGIIGLLRDDTLTYGYDGRLSAGYDADSNQEDFTVAEKEEIARYMIDRWVGYLNSLGKVYP